MDRRYRTAAVVALALITASIASFGVLRAVRSIPVREVEVAHYYVAVAAQPLRAGARVTAPNVKLVAWPSANPVPGAITRVEAIANRGLLAPMAENEPFTDAKLAPLEAGAGLPPSIPPGMRAMSVKVNEVIGVAGFVVPGSRVDVMVTIRQQHDSVARTVASNVQVLTAGTRYDQEKARDGQPIPSTVVTLMVAPTEAERIVLAQAEGNLMLALRNPLDSDTTPTPGARTATLLGHAPQAPSAPAAARPRAAARPSAAAPAVTAEAVAAPQPYRVETIRAAKRSEEVVR